MPGTVPTNCTTLDCVVGERILTVTLNRPEELNSFTPTMARELVEVFEQASLDDSVGAVVVTGAGRAFCAGMDLSAEGNVFGLDETLQSTPADLVEPSTNRRSSTASAIPAAG